MSVFRETTVADVLAYEQLPLPVRELAERVRQYRGGGAAKNFEWSDTQAPFEFATPDGGIYQTTLLLGLENNE